MEVLVRPLQALAETRAEAVVVCSYDVGAPMREGFLPPGAARHPRMYWVFGPAAPTPGTGPQAEELR
jgi:hypothetical protein